MTTTFPTQATMAEQASVAAFTQQVVAAWAYADGDAFADLFTEDGTLCLPGVFAAGREAIRAYFKDAFENAYKNTQVTGKPISMRFYGPDVVMLLSSGGVMAAGESEVADIQQIRASWFIVRVGDVWRLAAYQNTPATRTLPTPGE